jgi:2-methylcitrate dehydratase PrpD
VTAVDDRERAQQATAEVGRWVASLRWDDVPAHVRSRLELVLLDTLGVCLAGAREPEQRRLVEAWRAPPGPAPLMGAGRTSTVEASAWLNAAALVRLELDEGNKYAKGHPAAHAFPAVLALAADVRACGPETMAALLAAYEVAARFGRATRLHAGAHPHGSWGVAGAAAGCARLLGLGPDQVAAAVDAGAGLPVAGHFASALDGNPVRDGWVAASNLSGLVAARMAQAGVARNTGTAALALGELLGTFDPPAAADALGRRWDVELGYFKRHASCSFTHPAADAVLTLRRDLPPDGVDEVHEVLVETHALAAGLSRTTWDSRLGALFSTPFVVAAALVHGHVRPSVSSGSALHDPRVAALAARVVVREAAELTARLPDERAARVTVRRPSGDVVVEVPNPVGDSAHHPMDAADLQRLLSELLGAGTAAEVADLSAALATTDDVSTPLRRLADL